MAICSIIIPAHNEKRVIGRLLKKIVSDDQDFEIIVVCNGCNDETAGVARKFGNGVTVVETEVASKTHALQIGDSVATFWPRIYMDADVILDAAHINHMVKVINSNGFMVVSPVAKNNMGNSSWPVRAFYNIWCRLPYYSEGMIGTGVYCLSEKGRKHFDRWPDIISDDGYIRALFKKSQRGICKQAIVEVNAPINLRNLLKVKTRSRLGRYQLEHKFPALFRKEQKEKKYSSAFGKLAGNPLLWGDMTIYLLVNLITRLRAGLQFRKLSSSSYQWEKDWSTR